MSNTTRQIVINDPKTLSGKPTASMVKIAKEFAGDITASVGSRQVSAKSLGQFLSLSPQAGQTLSFSAVQEAGSVLDKMVGVLLDNKIGSLATTPAETATDPKPQQPLEKSVVILMANGMHARPATQLVGLAKGFAGKLEVSKDGEKFVMAKSLSKLLSIGISYGDTLIIRATPDGSESAESAQAYFDKVVDAVEKGLGDEITPLTATEQTQEKPQQNELSQNEPAQTTETATRPAVDWSSFDIIEDVPNDSGLENNNSTGIPASAGMAIAPAYIKQTPSFAYDRISTIGADAEKQKLTQAIEQAKADIAKLIEQSQLDEIKAIFNSHLEILDDPAIIEEVEENLQKEQLSAPSAWNKTIAQAAKEQEQLTDRLLAQRAADFRDVGERVMAILCGVKTAQEPTTPYILVMSEVGPSDVASLDPKRVAGILTAVGGASAHSAIVARALGIPAVVGAGSHILDVANNTSLIINGETGSFTIDPDPTQMEIAKAEISEQLALKTEAKKHAHEVATTLDGHKIEIAANIGDVNETTDSVKNGAEAIGLFRTELVFMKEAQAPNESKQTEIYSQVFKDLDGRPLVVRTLDVGGDKPLPYIPIPHEDNPFLGMRGVRLSLRKPELLREQVTALLKAAANKYPLRIMFPMVGRIEEWRFAKSIVDEVRATYPCDDLQVGIMIEVPSAALMSHVFAREVDFFSVGTNDLTQYTMAIDRGHPVLSADACGLHPSVLGLIDLTVHNAHKHGKWVGVCGELAADAAAVPVLLGLGVDELSMSATSIPLVKAQIRKLNYTDCKILAKRALSAESSKVVRALVKHQQLQQFQQSQKEQSSQLETKSQETKVEESKPQATKVPKAKVEETKVKEVKVEKTKVEKTKSQEKKAEEGKLSSFFRRR